MNSAKNAASAVGGKTARTCDSCMRKRARWYCAADDAFLCLSCDSLVHSANPLARRHERLRLKTSSVKYSSSASSDALVLAAIDLTLAPSWHRGITKKPRTPRHGKNQSSSAHQTPRGRYEPTRNPFHLVPEVGSDEYSNSHDENEEQLLYRVPIFDPFVTELCTPLSSATSAEAATAATPGSNPTDDNKASSGNKSNNNNNNGVDNLHGFLPSEMELAQFAADVESLLGRGLENECIGMEDLGLIGSKEKEESRECCVMGREKVKVEDDEESPCKIETADEIGMEMGIREPFEKNFDYDDSPAARKQPDGNDIDGDEDEKKVEMRNNEGELKANSNQRKRKILLQLDYEAVISAWASQKSPWTTGGKPELDADECWLECVGTCGMELHQPYYGEMGAYGGGCQAGGMGDGGREARVTRYREKRRTRLFSKKIRYEVRKLNAEKRPRMKGRFVKRASFAVATQPPPSLSSCPLRSR